MQDIRHGDDGTERSIRNIPVGHRRPARSSAVADRPDRALSPDGPAHLPRRRRRSGRFWLFALGVAVLVAIGGVLVSTVFAGARVTVYPRTETVVLPATLQAQANAPAGVLPYQTVSVTRSASQSVPAQSVQKVSRPASGVVTVSNAYSSASQRLIANTRFEAPDGRIYRIRDSVTVPGMKQGVAGTVSATLYADSPGPAYNKSGGVSFTIPGFKNDPRYAKITARSEGALSGGFVGDEPVVAPADLAAAKAALQKQLDGDVRAAAAQAIPDGFAAVPGSLDIVFADVTQTIGADKTAQLTEGATATGIIVRKNDLASAIAHKAVAGYKGEAVLFGDEEQMSFSLSPATKRNGGGPVTLTLSGSATLVWQFDPEALKAALAGKDKKEVPAVAKAFEPAVAKMNAAIKPFWQGKLPQDPAKIKVIVGGK